MSGNEFACSLGSSSAKISWVWRQKTRWKMLANNARRYSSRCVRALRLMSRGGLTERFASSPYWCRGGASRTLYHLRRRGSPPTHRRRSVRFTCSDQTPQSETIPDTWEEPTPALSSAPQVLVLTKAALVFLLYYSLSGVSFILEACKSSLLEWKRGILLASSLEVHYTKVILIFIYYNSSFY